MTNIEYRFPLYRSLGSTLFFDGGILTNSIDHVSLPNIEWDGGVGMTINTPLGPAGWTMQFKLIIQKMANSIGRSKSFLNQFSIYF